MVGAAVIFFSLFLIFCAIQIWADRVKPNSEFLKKYPKKVRFFFRYPFFNNWKKEILAEDLENFEGYQFRLIIRSFYGVFMIIVFWIVIISLLAEL